MAKGWKQAFDDPIPLPSGRQLVTLQAAGNYITKLPKAEYMAPKWQTATESRGGPRADHARAYRHFGGNPPQRSPRVQSRSERHALGKAEAETGRISAIV
jgi:hypothetical protein